VIIAAHAQETTDDKPELILPSKTFRPEFKKPEPTFSFAYISTFFPKTVPVSADRFFISVRFLRKTADLCFI